MGHGEERRVGVDLGATLTKVVSREGTREPRFEILPSADAEAVAARVEARAPTSLGVAGAGAARLLERLGGRGHRFDEFEAIGRGARSLLAEQGEAPAPPYLLVSLGTGTSVLRIEGDGGVSRAGGTSVGGGAIMGLGRALLGPIHFEELCALAEAGASRRGEVDLLVGDIYAEGEIALPPQLVASTFAKLGRADCEPPSREALAASLMALVGEAVGWITGFIAEGAGIEEVVLSGASLRGNPALANVAVGVLAMRGRRARVLRLGEFAGASGALELAAARAG